MRINHNIAALNTYRQLTFNNASSQKSLEKLSSGLRINRAGDDAAGLAISEKMRAQIRGLDQASRNAQDSISLIQTSEGALNETHSILQRMRELAVQSANDTNVSVDREEIQKEINQLTSEINRIGNTTEFNTQKLLNGDKANTFAIVGTTFSGGATTANLLGITTSLVTGSAGLNSGTYRLVITKTTTPSVSAGITPVNSGLNESGILTPMKADVTYASAASKPIFGGGGISVTSGVGNWVNGGYGSGAKIEIERGSGASGQYVEVRLTDASGYSSTDKVFYSGVSFSYNDHGVSFSLNTSGWSGGAGAMVSYTTANGAGGATIGTTQELWTTMDLVPGGAQPSWSGGGIQTTSAAAEGDWTVSFRMSGALLASITVKLSGGASGTVIHDILSGAALGGSAEYSAHGISFNLTSLGGLDSGTHTLEFTTRKKVETAYSNTTYQTSFSAHLINASGNVVGASGVIGTSAAGLASSGSTTVAGGSYTVGGGGLAFTLAAGATISAGTSAAFTVNPETTGADKSMAFQIGANQNQIMNLTINDMRSAALGISATTAGTGFNASREVTDGSSAVVSEFALDVTTSSGASNSITKINAAIEAVSSERAKLGAVQNRLEHTINNLGTSAENLQAAESRVRDVDMARVMMEFTKDGILQQAAQAMLAQANQQPQGVLQLLR